MEAAQPALAVVGLDPAPADEHETLILPAPAKAAFARLMGDVGAIRPALEGMSTTNRKAREAKAALVRIAYRALEASEEL